MKRSFFVIAVAMMFMVLNSCSVSQKATGEAFEGVVFYSIDYPESDFGEEVRSQLPMGMTVYLSGDMVKSKISGSMFTQTIITDRKANTVDQLMEIMGQKYHIAKTAEEIEEDLADAPETKVEYLDETREIAGHKAQKVKVVRQAESGEEDFYAWVNKELGENFLSTSEVMKDVKGFPLQYEFEASGFTMRLTASKVEEKNIKNSVFEIPEGYEKVTEEELKNKFGGM